MKRARQDVEFHHKANAPHPNDTLPKSPVSSHSGGSSHELDAITMRETLAKLFAKSLDMRKKKKDYSQYEHYHREGVFRDNENIERPPIVNSNDEFLWEPELPIQQQQQRIKKKQTSSEVFQEVLEKIKALGDRGKEVLQRLMQESDKLETPKNITEAIKKAILNSSKLAKRQAISSTLGKNLAQDDDDENAAIELVFIIIIYIVYNYFAMVYFLFIACFYSKIYIQMELRKTVALSMRQHLMIKVIQNFGVHSVALKNVYSSVKV